MASEDPSITTRLEALERRSAGSARRDGVAQICIAVLFVGSLILLTSNVWLMLEISESRDVQSVEHQFWLLCHERSTSAERTHAFLELIKARNTEWKSARLEKLELAGADLIGVDVQFANLMEGDLTKASFQEANLFRSSFELTDLSDANLSKTNLSESTFLKAKLNGANLRDAVLVASSLEQATARNANLILADLSEAHLLMTDLTGANLTGANLSNANLEAAILTGARLSLTRLAGANLKDTDFTDSNWWRAQGLDDDQQRLFVKKFAPSKNADPNYKRDFWDWGKGLTSE